MGIPVLKDFNARHFERVLFALALLLSHACAFANPLQVLAVDDTRHFLQRAGFALPPEKVIEKSSLGREQLVQDALQNRHPICPIEPPAWTQLPLPPRPDYKSMDEVQRKKVNRMLRQKENKKFRELQLWWLDNLVKTENPLGTKMVLFWQNHFTSAQRKIRHAQLLYNQHVLFQKHALGNFAELLHAMVQDPAMLIYLDNRNNVKSKPNENLARELLELFTLGEGNYTETDIKEAARALTGYGVTAEGKFRLRKNKHDNKYKHILGTTAEHDAQTLVTLLLAQPDTAEFLVEKLWKEFVSLEPDEKSIRELAQFFKRVNYEIKPLLAALFNHQAFWHSENRAVLVKSPAQFVSDTLRVWQFNTIKPARMLKHMRSMEQNLFNPPNVSGWPGGTQWINSTTLLARNSFLKNLLSNANDRKDSMRGNRMGVMQMQDPNRSHFRSIEIWETASDANETLVDGWLKPIAAALPKNNDSGVKAIALANDHGPLAGDIDHTVVFDDLTRFIKQAKRLRLSETESTNVALQHVLKVQRATQKAAEDFALSLQDMPTKAEDFPANPLGRQLGMIAHLIQSGGGPQIYKVSLGSFDTHANQPGRHTQLLRTLADGVSAFRGKLQSAGLWDKVLVMTYSEFGRRAKENASRGTDHGTAAAQFVFGGAVRGGMYGQHPSLKNLIDGDLQYAVDFRSVYHTVARDWLQQTALPSRLSSHERLGFIT